MESVWNAVLSSYVTFLRTCQMRIALRRLSYETISDELFAPRCWATKEEWEEFDRIINLDGVVWFYDKVDAGTKLYISVERYSSLSQSLWPCCQYLFYT